MKAILRKKYGPPNAISVEQADSPRLKNSEVLIRVHATTVNRTDCAHLRAKPFIMRFFLGLFKPNKPILGTDFAGEVCAVGAEVGSFKMGDRVFGFKDTGAETQAEYLALAEKDVFPIPAGLDYQAAAASLEGAHYAYSFIRRVDLKAGQTVFINGATGAIGSALLQFLRPHKVKIIATAKPHNIELITALGADEVIDYSQEDFSQKGGKYDIIFDAVGKSSFGKCKSLLTKKGKYISSEPGPFAQNIWYPLFNFLRPKKVLFPVPYSSQESIPYLMEQIAEDNFKPLIDRTYDLAEAVEAYHYVLKGEKTGNVVLRVVTPMGGDK